MLVGSPDTDGVRVLYNSAFLVVPDGTVVEVVGLATDVTERRNAERALTAEREFSTAVVETSGTLVVVLDRDARIVRFNRACERTTGFLFPEVRGRPVWELVPPDAQEGVRETFEQLLAKDFPNQHENAWVTKNGLRRLIAWSNTALLDDAGDVVHVKVVVRKRDRAAADHFARPQRRAPVHVQWRVFPTRSICAVSGNDFRYLCIRRNRIRCSLVG